VDTLVGDYKSWSEAVEKAPASVAVLYASDYGFSDRLSQSLARGVTKAAVGVEMADLLSVDQQVGVMGWWGDGGDGGGGVVG
jgi:flavorubredoxin